MSAEEFKKWSTWAGYKRTVVLKKGWGDKTVVKGDRKEGVRPGQAKRVSTLTGRKEWDRGRQSLHFDRKEGVRLGQAKRVSTLAEALIIAGSQTGPGAWDRRAQCCFYLFFISFLFSFPTATIPDSHHSPLPPSLSIISITLPPNLWPDRTVFHPSTSLLPKPKCIFKLRHASCLRKGGIPLILFRS